MPKRIEVGPYTLYQLKHGSISVNRKNRKGVMCGMFMNGPTIDQFVAWACGEDRRMIQDAFPTLSAAEREFILSGTTPEEWGKMFPKEDDEA